MFKFIAQMAVNSALPKIKSDLIAWLTNAIHGAPIGDDVKVIVIVTLTNAVTNWTIKV